MRRPYGSGWVGWRQGGGRVAMQTICMESMFSMIRGRRGEVSGIESATHSKGYLPDASPVPSRSIAFALQPVNLYH